MRSLRASPVLLGDLRQQFPVVSLQGMLECAGSGRSAFSPTPSGTPWLPTGGMGCPKWTGVRLRDVLDMAGVAPGAVARRRSRTALRFMRLTRPS